MAEEREDTVINDECAENLSDIPVNFANWKEDIVPPKNKSEEVSLEDGEILTRRIRRTVLLPTDLDESVYHGQTLIYLRTVMNLKGLQVPTYFLNI